MYSTIINIPQCFWGMEWERKLKILISKFKCKKHSLYLFFYKPFWYGFLAQDTLLCTLCKHSWQRVREKRASTRGGHSRTECRLLWGTDRASLRWRRGWISILRRRRARPSSTRSCPRLPGSFFLRLRLSRIAIIVTPAGSCNVGMMTVGLCSAGVMTTPVASWCVQSPCRRLVAIDLTGLGPPGGLRKYSSRSIKTRSLIRGRLRRMRRL